MMGSVVVQSLGGSVYSGHSGNTLSEFPLTKGAASPALLIGAQFLPVIYYALAVKYSKRLLKIVLGGIKWFDATSLRKAFRWVSYTKRSSIRTASKPAMAATRTVEPTRRIMGFSGVRRTTSAHVHADAPVYYWGPPTDKDVIAKAKEAFDGWEALIGNNEKAFEQYVYKNPELHETDLIQFRSRIFTMLSLGEDVALQFYRLATANKMDATEYFKKIDQHMQTLIATLNDWNSPLETQSDIPDDFKQGIRDIAEGKVVDLEKALAEKPPNGAKVQSV